MLDNIIRFAAETFWVNWTGIIRPWRLVKGTVITAVHYSHYKKMSKEVVSIYDLTPCCVDRTTISSRINDMYTYQDTWVARRIMERKPAVHLDVASSAPFLVMLSLFTEVMTVDIRPIQTNLPGIIPLQGDVTDLDFEDNSISSISSLSVIEHVGLGRYGDRLDPEGTIKAAGELQRVLAPGGDLYVAVPTGSVSKVSFNAHRIFRPEDFIELFSPCRLVGEIYVLQGGGYMERNAYDSASRPYAYGCYHFTKTGSYSD
ncbi:MAG: DUF268 domain-containing protein [Sedimentisphaerales bacterium]|nr:DUF268 domain-containing protein [Sedimentisphaerales bacterium]